ncbi:hypothetical protein IWT140_01051 [Secundilactobacillus pentosiphilus]|uniref:Uncharacterized protein n=1 Tax=Secundilactobacillus pentosiphilus TaxID=1714682 RepID=A0A1Z5IP96_9LACO|nr:hypothetical protein [Secundilactobacillus pentosiphilus]GAX03448.1 hypothetical protein IWT140_01051 [Secundilactobacillus pentosiphilus]
MKFILDKLGWILFIISLVAQVLSYFKVPDMFLKKFEDRLKTKADKVEMEFTQNIEDQKENHEIKNKTRNLRMDFYPRLYEEMYISYSTIYENQFKRNGKDLITFKNDIVKSHLLMTEDCYIACQVAKDKLLDFLSYKQKEHFHPEQIDVNRVASTEKNFTKECEKLMDDVEKLMRRDLIM